MSLTAIFLNKVLRIFAVDAKSYIRHMSDFLQRTQDVIVPIGAILISFDVTSLYTTISHERELWSVGKVLNKSIYLN